MKKVNLLSKAEMKKVLGGIISPEVWLEMCLAGYFVNPPLRNDGSLEDEMILDIIRPTCNSDYSQML